MKAKTLAAMALIVATAALADGPAKPSPTSKPVIRVCKADTPLAIRLVWAGMNADAKKRGLADVTDQIDKAKKEEARLRSLKVGPGKDFATVDDKKKAVADQVDTIANLKLLKEAIANADGKLIPYVSGQYLAHPYPIKADTAGTLSIRSISQVVDGHTAIVKVMAFSDNGMTGCDGDSEQDIWLTGVDTSTWTDDKDVFKQFDVVIGGTHKYDTAIGGTRTILAAKPFVIDDYLIDQK